jgi:hypothetical protein
VSGWVLPSLGGVVAVPLFDLNAMGQRLSLLTAVVVWQSLWCSRSVAKVLAGVGYPKTVCAFSGIDFFC